MSESALTDSLVGIDGPEESVEIAPCDNLDVLERAGLITAVHDPSGARFVAGECPPSGNAARKPRGFSVANRCRSGSSSSTYGRSWNRSRTRVVIPDWRGPVMATTGYCRTARSTASALAQYNLQFVNLEVKRPANCFDSPTSNNLHLTYESPQRIHFLRRATGK